MTTRDAFDVLGIEPSYALAPGDLETRQRELSRALHPDRYQGRPASERQRALSEAITVNEAVRTLKNPVKRAEVLLARHGVTTRESGEPPADPEFLMTVMELREELSSARRARDVASVERLCDRVRSDQERVDRSLALGLEALAAGANRSASEPGQVVALLGQLRYYRRFFDEADAVLDDLG